MNYALPRFCSEVVLACLPWQTVHAIEPQVPAHVGGTPSAPLSYPAPLKISYRSA